MIGKDGRCLDNYLNFKTREKIKELTEICKKIQNMGQHFMILKGGIAVGKTLFAKEISKRLVDDHENRIHFFQLHEGYSYRNFVYGQQIQTDGGQIKYEKGSQPLLKIIKECAITSELHGVILDDMNRCNLSEVLGDLLSALESNEVGNTIKADKDDVTLPNNLFFIGTMNTLVGKEVMDYAWFRRFMVVELKADCSYFEVDKNESKEYELYKWYAKQIFEHVRMLFERYFSDCENKAEMEKYVIGQGMFLQCENKDLAKDLDVLHLRLKYILAPLLLEYVSNGVLCDYIRNDIVPLTNMWGNDILLKFDGKDIGLNETIKKIIEDEDLPSNIKYFFFLHGNNIMFNIGMKIEDRMVCNMLIEYSDYVKEHPNLVYAKGNKNKGQPTKSIYSENNIMKIDNIDYRLVTATLLAQMKLYNGEKWERCTQKRELNKELVDRFGNEKKKFKKIKEIMRI